MSYGTLQIEKMTTESGYSLGAGNASSYKNRLINGGMVIDQRNNGASISADDLAYPVDRTYFNMQTNSKGTGQRSSDAPAGFTNSLIYTNGSAYTVGTNETYGIIQKIEGYNIADLAWGTASAKSVTLSFWVKSSLTGTFGGAVKTGSGTNYTYAFSYTINAANTWEFKSITISGPTVGTWDSTNGVGLRVALGLGNGSGSSISPNSWTASNAWSATGAVSVLATASATWQITGLQFEVGTVATSFDFRSYGTEIGLCRRYLRTIENNTESAGFGFVNGTNAIFHMFDYGEPMRSTPSVSYTGGTAMGATNYSSNIATINSVSIVQFSGNAGGIRVAWNLASTPSQQACGLNPSGNLVLMSAEL
jgi:hypothetical protein